MEGTGGVKVPGNKTHSFGKDSRMEGDTGEGWRDSGEGWRGLRDTGKEWRDSGEGWRDSREG